MFMCNNRLPKDMPFIKSNEPQHNIDETFDPSRGLDFLIDQFRFPPLNVTVTKILVRVCNKGFNDLIGPAACIPDVESLCVAPNFFFRMELREERQYPKDAFVFMIFLTIEERSQDGQPGIVGYSFFPLFLDKKTGEPATDETEECVLHNGQYQIPVFCQDYPYTEEFKWDRA